jgi:hypothetical protein
LYCERTRKMPVRCGGKWAGWARELLLSAHAASGRLGRLRRLLAPMASMAVATAKLVFRGRKEDRVPVGKHCRPRSRHVVCRRASADVPVIQPRATARSTRTISTSAPSLPFRERRGLLALSGWLRRRKKGRPADWATGPGGLPAVKGASQLHSQSRRSVRARTAGFNWGRDFLPLFFMMPRGGVCRYHLTECGGRIAPIPSSHE